MPTRVLIFFMLLFLVSLSHAQDSINQLDQYGYKTGKWIEYTDSGKIDRIRYHRVEIRLYPREKLFFEGITDEVARYDTITRIIWEEDYIYNSDHQLIRIRTRLPDGHVQSYFGEQKQITGHLKDTVLYRPGHIRTALFPYLLNRTNEPIALSIQVRHRGELVDSNAVVLKPNDPDYCRIPIPYLPGKNQFSITLTDGKTIHMLIRVAAFGYDLALDDLATDQMIHATDSSIFVLRNSFALCQVYDSSRTELLASIPLSTELHELNLGKYIDHPSIALKFTSFAEDRRVWARVKFD